MPKTLLLPNFMSFGTREMYASYFDNTDISGYSEVAPEGTISLAN